MVSSCWAVRRTGPELRWFWSAECGFRIPAWTIVSLSNHYYWTPVWGPDLNIYLPYYLKKKFLSNTIRVFLPIAKIFVRFHKSGMRSFCIGLALWSLCWSLRAQWKLIGDRWWGLFFFISIILFKKDNDKCVLEAVYLKNKNKCILEAVCYYLTNGSIENTCII